MKRRDFIAAATSSAFFAASTTVCSPKSTLPDSHSLVDTPEKRKAYLEKMLKALVTDLGPRWVGTPAMDRATGIVKSELALAYDVVDRTGGAILGRVVITPKEKATPRPYWFYDKETGGMPNVCIGKQDISLLDAALADKTPVRMLYQVKFTPGKTTSNVISITWGSDMTLITRDEELVSMLTDIDRTLNLPGTPQWTKGDGLGRETLPLKEAGLQARGIVVDSVPDNEINVLCWHRPDDIAEYIRFEPVDIAFRLFRELVNRLQTIPG